MDISEDEQVPEEFIYLLSPSTIILMNKTDLMGTADLSSNFDKEQIFNLLPKLSSEDKDALISNIIFTSTKNKQGLDRLLTKIGVIAETIASPSENPQITRQRHRLQLEKASNALSQFSLSGDLVMAAEDLRMTIRYLSNITGDITVEEILGEIFSSFCIGK